VSDLAKAKAILEQTLQATSASLFAQISNHCATHNAGVQEQINVIRKQIFAIHNAKNIALGIQPKAYSPSDSKEKESRNLSYNKHDFRQVKTGFTIIAIAISLFVVISGIQLLRDPVAFITDVGQSLSGKKLIENEKWKEGWTQGRLDSYDIACINAAYKAQEPALLGMNDKEKKATATQIVSWCSCMSKLFAETFPYDDALRNESQNLKMLESSGETQRCRREADTAANAELAL
jgi:hypothetical protein